MHGGGVGVSGRMGENHGGLRTGWLAAFGTEGYEGEPPLMEELGVNFGHIKGKVSVPLSCFYLFFFSLLFYLSFLSIFPPPPLVGHDFPGIQESSFPSRISFTLATIPPILYLYTLPHLPHLLPSTIPHFPTLPFLP